MTEDTTHENQRTERAHREQEPSGPGHRTRNTTPRAGTVVDRSLVAKDTAPAKQPTEQAHRGTGVRWPRTPQTQHNTPSGHTGEREPSGPGHHTRESTH